ncbi:CapA family protein [Luteipulveratus flavus]|uniref:CapA family protein n=1 Tax=Luteipulveratus flavus TaxID=3031728 RepID=A0ABT6C7U5_9MICO|nr:CapA family protein [Luteipulveratus sp. YIM 133296]MDF8264950.1 CapA family protein [Luteipulveratus sp. YIM 133296]
MTTEPRSKRSSARLTKVVLPGIAAALALGCVSALTMKEPPVSQAALAASSVGGVVVDETGRPVEGATVRTSVDTVRSDAHGKFTAAIRGAELVKASAPGHKSRTQAVGKDGAVSIELTSQASKTLSLRFGGDVMMGRRFYESQKGQLPQLKKGSTAAEHAQILSAAEPLLSDADLTTVNLETPLLENPYYDPKKPRPSRFAPEKDLAFGSAPETAEALRMSGVDAVSLGNNHLYDAMDPGLKSTKRALDAAGIVYFGAGATPAEAWKPAVVTRNGQKVAMIGCTTVDGHNWKVQYVATPRQGGAAYCTEPDLRTYVAAARRLAPNVVVMIHGAVEYLRPQQPEVRSLFKVASDAGAQAVIASHPHVVGGMTQTGKAFVAETTGNLAFDQQLWATFPTYLMRVDLRGGVPVYSSIDPLSMQNFRPVPSVGALAQASARIAAGTVPGPARLGDSGAFVPPGTRAPSAGTDVSLAKGDIQAVSPGWWFSGVSQPVGGVRAGSDLLFGTGTFEDQDVDASTNGGDLWTLGKYAQVTARARCTSGDGESDQGIELVRSPVSTKDVFATPAHRQDVDPGQEVTLSADIRNASAGSILELRWYYRTEGKSFHTTSAKIPVTDASASSCRRVVINAVVPKEAHAVQPFLRLKPPDDEQEGRRFSADNVRLIQWAPSGAGGRQYDVVRGSVDAKARFIQDGPSLKDEGPLVDNPASR